MDIEQLLRDLARLEADGAVEAPAAFRAFSATSASPLAPDAVQIVAQTHGGRTFAVPALPSPLHAPLAAREDLERLTRPLFALESLGAHPPVSSEPHASRFLAQMPMAAPRTELVPRRAGLVLEPFELSYEFRAIEASFAEAAADVASALARQDEYARGKMTNTPFAPGGESLAELERAATRPSGDCEGARESLEDQALDELVLSGDVDATDQVRRRESRERE